MNKQEVIERMCAAGLLPVFRANEVRHLLAASQAYCDAGIPCIEYTMTMPDALALVRQAVAALPPDRAVGAGTVMDARTVELAVQAGAQFIAGPGFCPEVVEACRRLGVVSVAGAVTPTEIMQALRAGADVIKVFPASSVGPSFFAEVLGPFPGIRLMAAGGITAGNVKEFIRAGASVVTVLANGLAAPAYQEGRVGDIRRAAEQFVAAIGEARRERGNG
jgi:2-dehydro-3-deoxyphosphogluconate aldolase / (4S)-4-hydroxy-2-oxoglutarate aldolase